MNRKGFTLVELLIVVGVLVVLLTAVVLLLNPVEFTAQGKDLKRISDLKNMDTAITLLKHSFDESLIDNAQLDRVYISLPDTNGNINDDCKLDYPSLPALSGSWQYRCNAIASDLKNINSTGWIPINLAGISTNPLSILPIDPVNDVNNYYTYTKDGALAAKLTSDKYITEVALNDGGNESSFFETAPVTWLLGDTWAKLLGGGSDQGDKIKKTLDGNYITIGNNNFSGNGLVMKTDSSGQVIWAKGINYITEGTATGIEATDGGYIISDTVTFVDFRQYLVKFNSGGNFLWAKYVNEFSLGGSGSGITNTPDGGFITGTYDINGKGFIIKFDSSGNVSWAQKIIGLDDIHDIVRTLDGKYIVVGQVISADGFDAVISKLSSTGTVEWTKVYDGVAYDSFSSVFEISSGYVVVGYTGATVTSDYLVMKLDASGSMVWSKSVGGSSLERATDVIEDVGGNYVVVGNTTSFGAGGSDAFVVKLNSSGNLVWAKTAGGTSSESFRSVENAIGGGYVFTGYTGSFGGVMDGNVFMVKMDTDGNVTSCTPVQSVSPLISSVSLTLTEPSLTAVASTPSLVVDSPTILLPSLSSVSLCP